MAILAGGLIWMMPTPQGLTPVGQAVVAILAFTVMFWIFGVLDNASTTLLMLALMMMAGVKPEHALGAFAGSAFWILLVVLFYGFAMQSTGLARRLSFVILSWFPPTYAGVLGAFFCHRLGPLLGNSLYDGSHRDPGADWVGFGRGAGPEAA